MSPHTQLVLLQFVRSDSQPSSATFDNRPFNLHLPPAIPPVHAWPIDIDEGQRAVQAGKLSGAVHLGASFIPKRDARGYATARLIMALDGQVFTTI